MDVPLNDILVEYFYSWRPYKIILLLLDRVHGMKRSLSWLKKRYKRLGLVRRGRQEPSIQCILPFVEYLINTPKERVGYRSIWRTLLKRFRFPVKRNTVMQLLQEIDPSGVAERRRRRLKRREYHSKVFKGPNHIWHIDGHDKLAPFGLCIHGCVDGFSRKILWLKLSPTNHDPKVIARFYLQCIEQFGGCPKVVRGDYGTENSVVAKAQIAFRMFHSDSFCGERSFFYGPSTANIRIESLWSQWTRTIGGWWIDMFRSLTEEGLFSKGMTLHRWIAYFVFVPLLEKDLLEFQCDWNEHRIRRSQRYGSFSGRPNDLFAIPECYGFQNQLVSVDVNLWQHCMMQESISPPNFLSSDIYYDVKYILEHTMNITKEHITHRNCKAVYISLLNNMNQLL